MNADTSTCLCANCIGAGCTCGCQSAAPAETGACQCGCAQGAPCTCAKS